MKICCQLPINAEDKNFTAYLKILRDNLDMVKRKNTEVVLKGVAKPLLHAEAMVLLGLEFLNHGEILKNILRAESEGFDGVCIGCGHDPVLGAAKQLLKIPVTGMTESAIYFACMMGHKFAMITCDSRFIPQEEKQVNDSGARINAIEHKPVRSLTMPSEELYKCAAGNFAPVIENFKQVGAGCIEDGADILIASCGLLSPMLTYSGVVELDGVPIIDPLRISLKLTEMFVDLHKAGVPTVSKNLLFADESRKLVEEELASLG